MGSENETSTSGECRATGLLTLPASHMYNTGFIFKIAFFCKNAAFESYGMKQSEGANMQISTGLPRPALRTLEAPEVAMQGER